MMRSWRIHGIGLTHEKCIYRLASESVFFFSRDNPAQGSNQQMLLANIGDGREGRVEIWP